MSTQKGPHADNLLGEKNPSRIQDSEAQSETKSPKGFVLDTGDGKMPKITLETKQSGQIGNLDINTTSEGSRSANTVADSFGPDENLRDQWIQA